MCHWISGTWLLKNQLGSKINVPHSFLFFLSFCHIHKICSPFYQKLSIVYCRHDSNVCRLMLWNDVLAWRQSVTTWHDISTSTAYNIWMCISLICIFSQENFVTNSRYETVSSRAKTLWLSQWRDATTSITRIFSKLLYLEADMTKRQQTFKESKQKIKKQSKQKWIL